jgi:ABC-type multidrug transport system permease subunit
VLSEPFLSALIATCLLCGLFMALVAGLSVVREREMGTLETIFYGPVSHLDYLLGKYSAYLIGYIVLIAAFLIFCAIIGWLTNLTISALLFYIAILSAAMGMGLIGLGLFIATIMRTVRGTLLLFVGLMLAALTLEVGRVILTSIISSRTFVGLIILRDTVTHLDSLIMWFTPASYLFRGADAALRQNWSEWLGYIAVALLYACITLSLSTALLRKRGVLR